MKWLKKYFRPADRKGTLQAIEDHTCLIEKTNEALDRLEKAKLDGEEHWLECTFETTKLKKDVKDDTFSGITRAHCRP